MRFTIENYTEADRELSITQKQLISEVFSRLEKIISFSDVQKWCTEHDILELIIFGSRTRLHEHEHSDLDIMMTSHSEVFSEENYAFEQGIFLKSCYNSFTACMKQAIHLDFKLNLCTWDAYAGLTYSEGVRTSDEVDFHFEYSDIPSFVRITPDAITFVLQESVDDVFDVMNFREF